MKKLILSAALIAISLQAKLYAQSQEEGQSTYAQMLSRSKTDQTFNIWPGLIYIRDFVTLKEGRLILELSNQDDYEGFRNLDSIVAMVRNDIRFYKDSLNADPTGCVRIDYVLNSEYSFRKMRFIMHPSKGSSFMTRDGEISKLKFEQDTVRIIIQKSRPGLGKGKDGPCMVAYSVQATLILGNYYDMDKVLADKVLNHIVDTLEKASQTKKKQKNWGNKPMSITYNPYYNGPGSLNKYDFLMSNEFTLSDRYNKSRLSFNPQLGAGLVRNTLVPVADIALQYNRYWNSYKERNIFRLSGTGYYFFDRDAKGNFLVNDNWFINATVGNISNTTSPGWYGRESTFGIGYLAFQKGGYFKNNTFRVFTDIMLMRGVSLVPEVIINDNFKQFFPGITLKVLQ